MRPPFKPRTPLRTRRSLPAICLALSLLSACGGGGGGSDTDAAAPIGVAPQVGPSTYQVNPGASWKPRASNQDYFSGSLASVNLAALGNGSTTTSVRTVQLQAQGSFKYNTAGALSSAATGMFVDAAGNPVTPNPGAPFVSPSSSADCGQAELGDSIPQDFVIPSATSLRLTLPAGATELRLSVSDCFYNDNSLSDDPLRIIVTFL